jgi:hypothetical protein
MRLRRIIWPSLFTKGIAKSVARPNALRCPAFGRFLVVVSFFFMVEVSWFLARLSDPRRWAERNAAIRGLPLASGTNATPSRRRRGELWRGGSCLTGPCSESGSRRVPVFWLSRERLLSVFPNLDAVPSHAFAVVVRVGVVHGCADRHPASVASHVF